MIRKIKNIGHYLLTQGAHLALGFPERKLTLVGVTGTDGKTTTVHLINTILRSAGRRVAYISSIHARIGQATIDTGLHTTTPYHLDMPKLLRRMVEVGIEIGVIEVTSHALDQHRVSGLRFAVGVFTNVSREHLDYHHTQTQYLAAKASMIRQSDHVVFNRDDASFQALATAAERAGKPMTTYAIDRQADLQAEHLTLSATGSSYDLTFPNGREKVKSVLLGRYNVENMLAAAGAGYVLGIAPEGIRKGLENARPLPGRLETIASRSSGINVIVDFAHTPQAFAKLLPTLRTLTHGRLIHVFGAAGERDSGKRPEMGKIASRLADELVITGEDPRSESVDRISAEIAEGVVAAGGVKEKNFWMIQDRKEAIVFAVTKRARPGDLVVITGKGHERSMCFGKTETPWSDQEEVKRALRRVE